MDSQLAREQLQKYQETGFQEIQGWASPELFKILDLLNSQDFNQRGGVLEIGVHHGLFFLMLLQLAEANSTSYALDLFENQALNIDHSGCGDRTIFEQNLSKYGNGKNVRIATIDSTDKAAVDSLGLPSGTFKFISVDGGHTVEHTCSDLKLAEKYISNEGLVILDDFLNADWLGVTEGGFEFMNSKPTLVPLAAGHNKLFLCKISFLPKYWTALKRSGLVKKVVKLKGHETAVL
jgi:hypothetical protein